MYAQQVATTLRAASLKRRRVHCQEPRIDSVGCQKIAAIIVVPCRSEDEVLTIAQHIAAEERERMDTAGLVLLTSWCGSEMQNVSRCAKHTYVDICMHVYLCVTKHAPPTLYPFRGDVRKWGLSLAQHKAYMRKPQAELSLSEGRSGAMCLRCRHAIAEVARGVRPASSYRRVSGRLAKGNWLQSAIPEIRSFVGAQRWERAFEAMGAPRQQNVVVVKMKRSKYIGNAAAAPEASLGASSRCGVVAGEVCLVQPQQAAFLWGRGVSGWDRGNLLDAQEAHMHDFFGSGHGSSRSEVACLQGGARV